MKQLTLALTRSKTGLPCLWEKGGGYSNTGYAQLICASDGSKKLPVFINTKCGPGDYNHALLKVELGDYIIQATWERHSTDIVMLKAIKIHNDDLICEEVLSFDAERDGCVFGDDYDKKMRFFTVFDLARKKSRHYDCRVPYYIKSKGSDESKTSKYVYISSVMTDDGYETEIVVGIGKTTTIMMTMISANKYLVIGDIEDKIFDLVILNLNELLKVDSMVTGSFQLLDVSGEYFLSVETDLRSEQVTKYDTRKFVEGVFSIIETNWPSSGENNYVK